MSTTDKIETARVGDLVVWDNVALGKNIWRVVQVWCDSEPKRLLLTTVDYSGKCYPATADDCRIVERAPEEAQYFKRKPLSGSYATGYGRVEEPCKHPVALDHEI